MSEATLRSSLVRHLAVLDAVPVERNMACPGTPDINCTLGWIELKMLPRSPNGADDTILKIEHFTPQQRIFLRRRWDAGGGAWLLLQQGRKHFMLFDGQTAATHVGRATMAQLAECALAVWRNGISHHELIKAMRKSLGGIGA